MIVFYLLLVFFLKRNRHLKRQRLPLDLVFSRHGLYAISGAVFESLRFGDAFVFVLLRHMVTIGVQTHDLLPVFPDVHHHKSVGIVLIGFHPIHPRIASARWGKPVNKLLPIKT